MKDKRESLVVIVVVALSALLPAAAAAETNAHHLDLRSPGWEIEGEDAVVEEFNGQVALSFMTFGTPPGTYVANYANVVVRPGVVDYQFPPTEAPPAEPSGTTVETWRLSPAFAPGEGDVLVLPEETLASPDWQPVSARADGLVELERHVTRPEGARRASVLARLELESAEARSVRFDLGFSDEVSVFLNGRLLLVDDESYSFNLPRRQGLWSADQLSLFLPLEKGANELIVAVTDRFGGWALSGRIESSAGVSMGGVPASSGSGAPSAADLENELRNAEAGFADAFARRDAEAFQAFVAADAVFLSGPEVRRGRDAVMSEWGRMLAAPEAPFSWEPERVTVNPARSQGLSTGPVHAPDGRWVGSFVSLWERRSAGDWQVLFDVGPRCPPPPTE